MSSMSSTHSDRPADATPHEPGPARTWSRRRLLYGAAGVAGLTAFGSALPAYADDRSTGTRAAEAAAEGVTLKVMVNTPHVPILTTVVAPAWEKSTGGKLEVTPVAYDQLTAQQIADVQSGAGEFDLFDYFYYGLGSLVDAGALLDITDWVARQEDLNTRDYLPSIHDTYTLYKGRRFGLPYDGDQHLLYYNKEIFGNHDLTPPATWDEYYAAAKKITQAGGGAYYGAAVQGQPQALVLGCAFINRLVGYGGTLVDRTGRPTLTSDAAVAAAQQLIDINPYALHTPLQVGLDSSNAAFLSGQAAMLETWTGMAQRAADPALSKIVGKWGAVALPLGGSNTTHRTPLNTGYGLGVSTASSHKAEALAFTKWVTSTSAMLVQTTAPDSAIDPNRTSVLHSAAYAQATPIAVDLIRAGLDGPTVPWPKDSNAPANLQALLDQLALAIEGKQSAATALKNAQTSWERSLPS
jgi:multiple sugar transport system substrate-binding protein